MYHYHKDTEPLYMLLPFDRASGRSKGFLPQVSMYLYITCNAFIACYIRLVKYSFCLKLASLNWPPFIDSLA